MQPARKPSKTQKRKPARKAKPGRQSPATGQARAPIPQATRHDRNVAKSAAYNRRQSAIGRDIGDLPPVGNPKRREAARLNFRLFCETYLCETFSLAWSPDHLRVIERIEGAVLRGELLAFAMPRGSGKTSLASAASAWALIYGHHAFVAVVGSDEAAARRILASVWTEFETNDDLLEDFPEICYPIRKLERMSQRARGQLYRGEPTRIEKAVAEFVLPTIPGSAARGGTLRAVGITGGVRGLSRKLPDGKTIRPTLVLIDDPQTDASAASPSQVADRIGTMRGAILGLAGPKQSIAGLATVTVIRPGDMADQLLDRGQNPAWQGERASLVYKWPTAEELWAEYSDLRREGQRSGTGTQAATDFYAANREAMDAGSRVGWPERFNPDELSAIQHAYNLRIDRGDAAFFAEYQNQPLVPAIEAAAIDASSLRKRVVDLDRGIVPLEHSTLTIGVDVQGSLLYWLAASWGNGFSGNVVAYGTYPDQTQSVFTAATAKRTIEQVHAGGFEAALAAALRTFADAMLTRDWKREDGTAARIDMMLVDANWGKSTQTVREFARRHPSAAIILPAHGRGVTAASQPMNEGRPRPGERRGPGWKVSTIGNQRGTMFDSNFWKTFLAARLRTVVGDTGAVVFHRGAHDMLVEHLAAEQPVTVEAKGRVVEQWQAKPGAENHWLDCLVMSAVAASIAGITADGAESIGRRRRKVALPTSGSRRVIQVRPMFR